MLGLVILFESFTRFAPVNFKPDGPAPTINFVFNYFVPMKYIFTNI